MTPHGSYSTYTYWRCRCAACREANTVYRRALRKRHRYLGELRFRRTFGIEA